MKTFVVGALTAVSVLAMGVGTTAVAVLGAQYANSSAPTTHSRSQTRSDATPSEDAAPPPAKALEGAIAAPAIRARDIPWDQVGPGWFLLYYDEHVPATAWPANTNAGTFSEADGVAMLVSPAGDLYYAQSLAGLGAQWPLAWFGKSLALMSATWVPNSDDVPHGQVETLNLGTGKTSPLAKDVSLATVVRVLPDGTIATLWASQGIAGLDILDRSFKPLRSACATAGPVTVPAPDGKRVVCLNTGDDGKSAVMVHDLSGGAGTQVDTFKNGGWVYTLHGWWDANSFVLSRLDENGSTVWWAYDVTTGKIRDLGALMSNGSVATDAEGVAGYRVVTNGKRTEVQGFDGTLRATLPCAPSAITGTVALAVCGAAGGTMEIVVADLTTGDLATAASFEAPGDSYLQVFPAPGGERA